MIQYRQGVRVSLASESIADFTPAGVQLERGFMNFQTVSSGIVFSASTLRLEPATVKTSGNVSFQGSKASVSVAEGTLKVIDPSGVQLASLSAGEARLFEEAAATAASASAPSAAAAPAAPPQGGQTSSDSSRKWLIGVGVAVVGTSLGVAGLVRANDANSRADSQAATISQVQSQNAALATQVAQVQSQNAALSTQVTALRAQAAALSAQLVSLASQSNQVKAIQAELAAQLAELSKAEAQLSAAQQQTTQLVMQIASQGGQATPAQLQQLQSLSSIMLVINTQLGVITTKIINANQALNNIVITISPTRVS
ncbi:MAG: hypothetical protein HYX72_11470 [Acidobacteria bacterium]|nr:hypothetical protein [Acidobacteriota bacterium]